MREIKFRAKTLYGSWAYGYLTARERGLCIDRNFVKDKRNNEDPNNNVYECPYVDSSTIGQFTGFCDKKGEEIYEGDILKVDFLCHLSEVRYNKDSFMACKENYISYYLTEVCHNCVVIGNIHDNPEQMKGGTK